MKHQIIITYLGRQVKWPQIQKQHTWFGGAVDNNDINKGDTNPYNIATRELEEEIGISVKDTNIVKNIEGTYVISEGNTKSVGIVYKMDVNLSKQEINELYNKFLEKLKKENKEIEFLNLEYIKKDREEIEKYIKENLHDECIKELLEKEIEITDFK